MDGKIPLWKAAFQCLDEVLHFQRVTQQQFLDYSKLTQYFETESEVRCFEPYPVDDYMPSFLQKFASIDRLLEHLLRQISYGSEKIKQDIHEMQRSHQKELDRLLQGFRYIVDPASPTPQITSDEKIDVFGPNVPILFSSKDMSVSIVHHDREIFTENSMPEIGKELDTIVCRRKDLEWVTRNLQQLGARLQTLNFVILNE
jgi:hypothetical protein